jgi:hypothetical protein
LKQGMITLSGALEDDASATVMPRTLVQPPFQANTVIIIA